MANPKHIAVVKKGADAIEEWRQQHPRERLDLSGADLSEVDLSKANLHAALLRDAYLMDAKLPSADLSRANVSCTNLINADLSNANLSEAYIFGTLMLKANLSEADLHGAKASNANFAVGNLSGTKLVGADLFNSDFSSVKFHYSDLSGADLSHATLMYTKFLETNFSNTRLEGTKLLDLDMSSVNLEGATLNYARIVACNLAHCVGLETVKHEGPSCIDFDTLMESFKASGNRLTSDLETFFLEAGIPKELLEALPRILAEVKYCTCFVCYGHPDLGFAKRLVKNLKVRGVSCWLYSLDYTPGEKVWGEIIERRREAEKMIVLCSAKALIRDGVLKEIEEQIDEDPDKIVPISLDNTWKESGFLVKRGQRDLKPFLLERNYADFADKSRYEGSLERLLKGIKRAKK